MKGKIREILRGSYGEFSTVLESQYEGVMLEKLSSKNRHQVRAWLTYNQVILELRDSLKNSIKTKELQYRLTEGENPNVACLEVMGELKDTSPELTRLYEKIMNF
jgi:hypothetical protein